MARGDFFGVDAGDSDIPVLDQRSFEIETACACEAAHCKREQSFGHRGCGKNGVLSHGHVLFRGCFAEALVHYLPSQSTTNGEAGDSRCGEQCARPDE
jgi:hypothetical protein